MLTFLQNSFRLATVAYTFKSQQQGVRAGAEVDLEVQANLIDYQVPGQPGINNGTLSQKKKRNNKE